MNAIVHKIILMRHAESVKNIKKIHGGNGEALTEFGKTQAVKVAKSISSKLNTTNLKLFSSANLHTSATAKIIAGIFNTEVEHPLDFVPLYFGIADGLSEQELTVKYPNIQLLFEGWRKREYDIKKLVVPEMEDYLKFWDRGVKFLSALPKDCDLLLVCSNSLMILLTHLMLGNHPLNTDKYKHIAIQNCGLIAFDTCDFANFSLDRDLTTVDLSQNI